MSEKLTFKKLGVKIMEIPEMLDELKQKAWHDDTLRQELLATR